jgi:hypothetical protein
MNKVNEIFRRTKWPDDNSDLIGLGFEVAEVCFILINFLTGMLGPPPPNFHSIYIKIIILDHDYTVELMQSDT